MIYLIIETNAILAQGGIIGALVDVGALLAVAAEPVVADALERPEGVQAARVCVAAAIVGRAFVDVLRKNKTRFKFLNKIHIQIIGAECDGGYKGAATL